MRKQTVLAILLLSVTLFSFNKKEKSSEDSNKKKSMETICGPAFDSLYNLHSTAFVSDVFVTDPLGNHFSLGFNAEPEEAYSISDTGSQCGYAGGIYHFFVFISNPTSGSVKVVDQFNNVIFCVNITSTGNNYHRSFNATCATTYRIIISDSSC